MNNVTRLITWQGCIIALIKSTKTQIILGNKLRKKTNANVDAKEQREIIFLY